MLFRREAIEARRRKLWGDVRLAQPPSLTVWTIGMSAICLIVVLALVFGRYTRKETVPGFLYAESGVVDVRPVQSGRVSRVLVREGQAVSAGDPLIEFISDLGAQEQGPVLDIQIAEADRQLQALERRQEAVAQSYASERRRLGEQIDAQQTFQDILLGQRRDQADAVALAEADLERIARLQEQGFAPGAEVDRRRRAVLSERSALRELDGQVAAAQARIADLRSQIAAIPSREAEVAAALNTESARVAQQRAELAVARGYVLRAPIDGTVSRILAREGFSPANNGRLLTIAPEGSMLYARLLVPTRAIGFLEEGQTANLQIDAFPFQRFGMIRGRISAIHPMVVRPGDVTYPIDQAEAAYEVDVFLPREHVTAYGERRSLRPGMSLRADLPIDRRRLWQQLFDPLLAARARS